VALALAAAVPLAAALWLADRLAAENLAFGLNPRLIDGLESAPALYGDLFRARKELYASQVLAVAEGLPADDALLGPYLEEAVRRTPRLRRCEIEAADGTVLAGAESPDPHPEGEWRGAPARAALPGGEALSCTFAIEARLFADLEEARVLAEEYRAAGALRPDIQRSYLRAFAALLLGFAGTAALAGLLLARRTTRRLRELMRALSDLARGDLSARVDPGPARDEVAELGRAFNAMVREVREGRDRIVYLEKISGWQDVARRLAHEIKNPLTPIQLAFQQLEAGVRRDPSSPPGLVRLVAEVGQVVREELGTLQRLVEEFSGFARLPEVRPEPADLGAFAEEVVRASPREPGGAELILASAAGAVPVALDRSLMRRVVANLLSNAEQAARPARARVHLSVAREGDWALLAVGDEGPGIPEDVRMRVFDPYFTTRAEGSGLGLSIAKKIVLQHGGRIEAGERPGGGALFTVRLPILAAGEGEAAAARAV
jgi:nitrogen fixation/metabolism regulation signal transduction histidine kinase